ncbi:phage tail tape measure protein [Streptomyces sp. NPDC001604]|uniref:phage tail tape measure protein n=1 Tax=Streptomyces sp. NPDC001604 TaxID=3364593 RepID=UPI00368E7B7F
MASTAIVYSVIARDAASRTFHSIGRAAGRTDSTLAKLGRTAKIAGEALAVGLAVGLGESAKQAAEFQSSMTKISTQAGGTAKDVKVLSDQVLKLGRVTQQGPQQLSEALYHLKSVGMDNVDAMKALKQASDLAAVGGSSLEETTNALAGAWRTGIKGAGSFHEAVSTVNAIIGAGNMRMEQFTEAIGTGILPSAKTFGLSLKQVGAALALMTDEGIPAVDAATRLRMSFSLLGAPSGAAEKQLKKIGLSGIQLANAMRSKDGLIGAISLLKTHLDKSGMSAAQQSQVLSRAFGGGRSSSAILTLINNLDVLRKKQDQVNRTTGRFDDAVKMQRRTAEAQWHLLTSNLEVMGIRVGTKVLPPLTRFVQFLSGTAMPAAGRFGRAIGKLIPVEDIKRRFGEAKGLVSDFFGGLHGQKAAVLPTPMLKAPAVPKMLAAPKSDAAQLGSQVHDAIAGGFKDIDWSHLGSVLGKGLGSAFQWIVSHGAELAKKLGQAIGAIDWVDVGKQFGTIALPLAIGFVNNLFEPLFHKDFWKKHWLDTILAAISVVPIGKVVGVTGKLLSKVPWGKVGEALDHIPWGKLIPFAEKLAKAAGPIFLKINEFVGKLALRFIEAFARRFPRIARFFYEQMLLLPVRLGDLGRLLARKGAQATAKMGQALIEHIPGMGNRFIRFTLKVFGRFTLWHTGLNLAKSLLSGIWSRMKDVGSWLKSHVVDPVVNWVKSGFGIASPSKVFIGIGRNLISGLKGGIVGAVKGIGGWIVDHIISPVRGPFSHSGSWLPGRGSAMVAGLKSGVWSVGKTIGGWIGSHVINPLKGPFAHSGSLLVSKGRALIIGLRTGITGAMKGIGSWVKGAVVDPIVSWVKRHFGINSPSKVFIRIGKSLTKGLVMGMAKTHPKEIAQKVFGSLPNALGGFIKHGLISAKNLGSKALKALGGLGGDLLGLLGLGGGGGGSSKNQQIGQLLAAARGWSGPQWAALKQLWNGESGWSETALNKSSGAFGIPQALPASKMASAGSDWKTNPSTQIKWGLSYIASRYGNPMNAYSAWLSRSPHWYAKGTGGAARGLAWVGEKGPELVNFKGGEDVLSHPQSMAFAKTHGIKLPGYASGTLMNAADRVHRDKQRVEDAKDALANAKRRHKGVAAAEKRLEAARKELKAAEIALRNAQRSAKTSISNTIATGLLKKLETGTSSAIASAIKSLATKLLNAGFNRTAASIQKRGAKLESLADKRAAIQKRIAEANQYAADQASNIRDFLSISGTSATDVSSLISQATAQQKTASGFVALSKSLKARGASKDLLQQLSDAGPGSQLATILGAKNVTTTDIDKLNKLMASGGKLATSFGKDMADMMYDSGKDASKGFLAGLKSQEKALGKQMAKLAKDLIAAIKKALKIKSPSGVFRDEVGKQVVLGWVAGMDAHGHLVGSSAQRLADTSMGVSLRRRYVPTAGRSGARQDDGLWERVATALESFEGTDVHVHFDDERLKDLIDVRVTPKVKASERTQAFRAKVGRR